MYDGGMVSRRTLLMGAAGTVALLGGGTALGKHEIDTHPGLRRFFGQCGDMPSLPDKGAYVVHTGTLRSTAMSREMPYAYALPEEGIRVRGMPLIVALPGDVDSSYYHPRADGTDMLAFVVDELVPHVERTLAVGGARQRRAVYGVSMGGYGALLIAQRYPHLVCAAAGGSPAVFQDFHDAITGHSHTFDSEADWQRWGLWDQLDTFRVPVRIDCGDADPFVATARQLIAKIPGAVGHIGSGCHEHGFWRRAAPADLRFLKNHLSSS